MVCDLAQYMPARRQGSKAMREFSPLLRRRRPKRTRPQCCTHCGLVVWRDGKASGALAVAFGAAHDFFLRGLDALPALDLDPLALFEILVVLEEVLDAADIL